MYHFLIPVRYSKMLLVTCVLSVGWLLIACYPWYVTHSFNWGPVVVTQQALYQTNLIFLLISNSIVFKSCSIFSKMKLNFSSLFHWCYLWYRYKFAQCWKGKFFRLTTVFKTIINIHNTLIVYLIFGRFYLFSKVLNYKKQFHIHKINNATKTNLCD